MCYYFATLDPDTEVENPRNTADCVGTLYTWHPTYSLGGVNDFNHQDPVKHFPAWIFLQFKEFAQLPELKDYTCKSHEIYVNYDYSTFAEIQFFNKTVAAWMKENLCILPVYLAELPKITLSTEVFMRPFDNIHIGFIYATRKQCTAHKIPFTEAQHQLTYEIEVLNYYMHKDVWSFTLYSTNDETFNKKITQHGEDLPDMYTYLSSCTECFGYETTKAEIQQLLNSY